MEKHRLRLVYILINLVSLSIVVFFILQECLEIELTLDKPYKWIATNNQERKIFLISLWKVYNKLYILIYLCIFYIKYIQLKNTVAHNIIKFFIII